MILGIMNPDLGEQAPFGLAIETSSTMGSVALGRSGRLLAEHTFTGPRRHAVEFLAAVDTLCREQGVAPQQIGEVYVSCGPGSFTGLRMGVSAARTIALVQETRLVAVPTLEVIAQNALLVPDKPEEAAVILDAKRGRVFAATFSRKQGHLAPASQPVEADPTAFLNNLAEGTVVLGDGVLAYRRIVEGSSVRIAPDALHSPRAAVVYRLGHELARQGVVVARRDLVPHYIRIPDAEERWMKRQRQ